MFSQYLNTLVGTIRIDATDHGISAIHLNVLGKQDKDNPNHHTRKAAVQLEQYFQGERTAFELDYDLQTGTDFQKQIWKLLLDIPYGKTISYHELSDIFGNVKAIRAVAAANGKNPIAICIPCHRVIGSDGSLTGYASGLDIKQKLLMLENPRVFGQQASLF